MGQTLAAKTEDVVRKLQNWLMGNSKGRDNARKRARRRKKTERLARKKQGR